MERILLNLRAAPARRVTRNGKQWLVAPATLIVPGVLEGSQGPLFYPPDECARNVAAWNNMPIVVYHPVVDGRHASAHEPGGDTKRVGHIENTTFRGKLRSEAWFDAELTQRVDKRVYDALVSGQPLELSTGLYTDNEPTSGVHNGRPYVAVARNYRPDHLAVLPDVTGACSLADGCGVLVNEKQTLLTRLAAMLGLNASSPEEPEDEDTPKIGQGKAKAGNAVAADSAEAADKVDKATRNEWSDAAREAAAAARKASDKAHAATREANDKAPDHSRETMLKSLQAHGSSEMTQRPDARASVGHHEDAVQQHYAASREHSDAARDARANNDPAGAQHHVAASFAHLDAAKAHAKASGAHYGVTSNTWSDAAREAAAEARKASAKASEASIAARNAYPKQKGVDEGLGLFHREAQEGKGLADAGQHAKAAYAHQQAANSHRTLASTFDARNGKVNARIAAAHDAAAKAHSAAAEAHTKAHGLTGNQSMTREQMIEAITANCGACSKESLQALNDEALRGLASNAMVANAFKEPVRVGKRTTVAWDGEKLAVNKAEKSGVQSQGGGADRAGGDDQDEDEEMPPKRNQQMTEEQWLAQAPPSIRAGVLNAKAIVEQERNHLVERLCANAADKAGAAKIYAKLSLEELWSLAANTAPVAAPAFGLPSYLGQGGSGSVVNATFDANDALPLPSSDWGPSPLKK